MNANDEVGVNCAAIVCGHIARLSAPILYAQRDLPEEPADSGWQFLCRAQDEDWSDANVWSISEVLQHIPEFSGYVNLPVGTVLVRQDPSSAWSTGG